MNEIQEFVLLINQDILHLLHSLMGEGFMIPEQDDETVRQMISCICKFVLLSYIFLIFCPLMN